MFSHQGQEALANVGLNSFAEGGVEPNDVPFVFISDGVVPGIWGGEFQLVVVATGVEGLLIERFFFEKIPFGGRNIAQALVDGCRDLFKDSGRVV